MLLSQLSVDLRDPQLLVYRELEAFREDFMNHQSGWSTVFSLLVYRHGDIIYRRVFNSFSFIELDRELGGMYLAFPEKPKGVHFVLSVKEFDTYGRLVETYVQFDGLLQVNYKKSRKATSNSTPNEKSREWILDAKLPAGAKVSLRRIKLSMRRASDPFRRKTVRTTKAKSPFSAVKGTRANPEETSGTYRVRNRNSNGVDTFYDTSVIRYHRTYTSVRTPGFKKKSRDHTLRPNPYSMSMYRIFDGTYESRTDSVTNGTPGWSILNNTIQGLGLMDTNPQPHDAAMVNPAIAKLAGKINAANVNLGEDLFTANQTIRLFTSNVTRLGKAFQLLRRGNLPGAMKQLRKPVKGSLKRKFNALKQGGKSGTVLAAEMWLELRYGWMPLIGDIKGSLAIFSQLLSKSPTVCYVHASKTSIANGKIGLSYDTITFPAPRTAWKYYTVTSSTKFGLYYKVDDVFKNKMSQLGLTSPVSLAWELIPYSFVVDWFLPIGQALEDLSKFEGLVFDSGYKTQLTKTYISVIFNSDEFVQEAPGFSTRRRNTGNGSEELVKMDRTILTDFPKPNFPRLKNPITLIHAANAAALLVTRFSRK